MSSRRDCLGQVRQVIDYKKFQWQFLCSKLSRPRLEKAMATFSCPISFPFRCSFNGNHNHNHRVDIKINGTHTGPIKLDTLNEIAAVVKADSTLANVHENGYICQEKIRQRIPTQKQLVDPYRQGLIIERGVGYRQTVVIRSYEVGPDKTATLESLLNLFQVIKL